MSYIVPWLDGYAMPAYARWSRPQLAVWGSGFESLGSARRNTDRKPRKAAFAPGNFVFTAPLATPSDRERLAAWLARNEKLPLEQYRDRPRILVNRVAASILLGRDPEPYRGQFRSVVAELDTRSLQPVLGWGNLAAAVLLLTGSGDAQARRCLDDLFRRCRRARFAAPLARSSRRLPLL